MIRCARYADFFWFHFALIWYIAKSEVFFSYFSSSFTRLTKKWRKQLSSRIFMVKLNALRQVSCAYPVVDLVVRTKKYWRLSAFSFESLRLTKFVILIRGLRCSWEKWRLFTKGQIPSGGERKEGCFFFPILYILYLLPLLSKGDHFSMFLKKSIHSTYTSNHWKHCESDTFLCNLKNPNFLDVYFLCSSSCVGIICYLFIYFI